MKLVGTLLLAVMLGSGSLVQGTTLQGERIEIKGANDAGVTADYYLRTYGVPLLGSAVGVVGLAAVPTIGLIGGGAITTAGLGIIFWPNIVSTAATNASAATLEARPLGVGVSSWLAWVHSLLVIGSTAGLVHASRRVVQRYKEVYS